MTALPIELVQRVPAAAGWRNTGRPESSRPPCRPP